MKSAASSNAIRTIIRDNYRKYWSVPLLGMVWFILFGFVPLLLNTEPESFSRNLLDMSHNQNFGYIMAILTLSIGSGMTVFSYLRNSGASDYMHSLPLRRSRLYAANVLSGLFMMAGPILINAAAMSIFAGDLQFVKWGICTGICCLTIFGITVFAGMLSGNTLMHLFNALFFNAFVTVFLLVIDTVCGSFLTGYLPMDSWGETLILSNPLTPFVLGGISRSIACLIYLPVGLLALIISGLLYQKRKIERTGESLVFPWVRALLFLYCVFCGSIIAGIISSYLLTENDAPHLDPAFIAGSILGTLLIFIIGSLLIDRSARIFTRRNLLPALLALLLAFSAALSADRDVFGYSSYVPDQSEIEMVWINPGDGPVPSDSIANYFAWHSRFNAEYYETNKESVAYLGSCKIFGMKSPEAVNAVRCLHQTLADQKFSDGYQTEDTIAFMYQLKNGHWIRREYPVRINKDDSGFPDMRTAALQSLQKYYDSEEFRKKYSLNNLQPDLFRSGTILYYPDPVGSEDSEEIQSFAIPRKYADDLKAALEADFQSCSYEDTLAASSFITVQPAGSSWEEIAFPVPENDKFTKAWLKEHADITQ